MDLSLDRSSEIPLGIQLIWKLRTAVATGGLKPGARLPGIRELAETARVNVNTVRSVLARLEDEGLLLSEQGRGTFVSSNIRPDATLADARDAAIERARSLGIDPQALAAALFISEEPPRSTATSSEQTRRRVLKAEIAQLERELGKLDPLGSIEVRPAHAEPRLLTTDELTDVRDRLAACIRELHHEHDEFRAEQAAAELEEQEQTEPAYESRWRNTGVWTGRSPARVSWTTP